MEIIRKRVPMVKTIASAITIGSGGSAGKEGPIAQIVPGFASLLASLLKMDDRDRRIMVLAGAAGGGYSKKMTMAEIRELPVVTGVDSRRVISMLSRKGVIGT